MKYVLIVCAALAAVAVTQSSPQTVQIGVEVTIDSEFVQRIIDQIEARLQQSGASGQQAQNLREIIEELAKLRDTLASEARSEALNNVQQLLAQIELYRVSVRLELIDLRDAVKARVLQAAANGLSQADREVEKLQSLLQDIYTHQEEDAQAAQQDILNRWNVWASKQLERTYTVTNGNQAALDKVEQLVNRLVNEYSGQVVSCADNTEQARAQYENAVINAVARFRNALQDQAAQVARCAGASGRRNTVKACSGASLFVKPLIDAGLALSQVSRNGVKLLGVRLAESGCVVQTLVQFGIRAFAMERQIDLIIIADKWAERNPQGSDSDSSDSDSSGSDSSDSDSSDSDSSDSDSDSSSSEESSGDSSEESSEASSEESSEASSESSTESTTVA